MIRTCLAALLLFAGAAHAEHQYRSPPLVCVPRLSLEEQLKRKYGEDRVAWGITSRGNIAELFV
ncbi:MAG: hypothetical protein AAF942_00005, partial [Pseudomonadota bacterium]